MLPHFAMSTAPLLLTNMLTPFVTAHLRFFMIIISAPTGYNSPNYSNKFFIMNLINYLVKLACIISTVALNYAGADAKKY